uniref:Uncharacterized protein n=1 Tax=Canis lupus dingo TaxID=286419 RepID=A0A8C0R8H9_CANLU
GGGRNKNKTTGRKESALLGTAQVLKRLPGSTKSPFHHFSTGPRSQQRLQGRRGLYASPRRAPRGPRAPCALHLPDPGACAGRGRWWPGTPGGAGGWDGAGEAQRAEAGARQLGGGGGGGGPRVRPCSAVPGRGGGGARCCGAAGRVLPVELEREGAPLCARERGHGPRAARRPPGARGAGGGGAGRRGAAAALAWRDASLICQAALQTSAFPPWAPQSPRGRAQPGAAAGPAPGSGGPARVWTRRGTGLRMPRRTARCGPALTSGAPPPPPRARAGGPATPEPGRKPRLRGAQRGGRCLRAGAPAGRSGVRARGAGRGARGAGGRGGGHQPCLLRAWALTAVHTAPGGRQI